MPTVALHASSTITATPCKPVHMWLPQGQCQPPLHSSDEHWNKSSRTRQTCASQTVWQSAQPITLDLLHWQLLLLLLLLVLLLLPTAASIFPQLFQLPVAVHGYNISQAENDESDQWNRSKRCKYFTSCFLLMDTLVTIQFYRWTIRTRDFIVIVLSDKH